MSILHILNGDSTLRGFEQTGIEGDILVWREVLSEGPLEKNIVSADFWKSRSAWLCETFGETPERYQEKVLDPLACVSSEYNEINLWFEFDLHCMVNLLGVMNYLNQKADLSLPAIYLICPAEFPGMDKFRGMGELNGEQLAYLYDNIRVQLSEIDFVIAAEAWDCYLSRDAKTLSKYLNETTFWANLHLLKPALQAHLKRIQLNETNLNFIEQKLLDIYKMGIKNRMEIYIWFWKTESIYGMGDFELDIYLRRLQDKGFISLSLTT